MRPAAPTRPSPARPLAAVASAGLVALALALPAAPAFAGAGTGTGWPSPAFVDVTEVPGPGLVQLAPAWPSPRRLARLLADDPQALAASMRVGLGPNLELRATTVHAAAAAPGARPDAFDALAGDASRIRRLHGVADVALGVRWRVRGGDAGWLPGVAWLAEVETPAGGPAFRAADAHPSLRATAAWALPGNWTLAVTPGVFRDRGSNGRRHACGLLAATMGRAWTPRLRGFVELAARGAAGDRAARADADVGLAFSATRALQLAAVLSRGVATGSPDPRAGLSVSARF